MLICRGIISMMRLSNWYKWLCYVRKAHQWNDPRCRKWSECWKGMAWQRDGRNGRKKRCSARSSTALNTQTLIGSLIPRPTSLLMNCLDPDDPSFQVHHGSLFKSHFLLGSDNQQMCIKFSFSFFFSLFCPISSYIIYIGVTCWCCNFYRAIWKLGASEHGRKGHGSNRIIFMYYRICQRLLQE